ncbi:MAG: protein-glutamine gamma-glutamyltransferase [Sporolactobacillus sp.]
MIITDNQELSSTDASQFATSGTHGALIFQAMLVSPEMFAFPSKKELTFELMMRSATINAAQALNESGAAFATFYYSQCNPDFWNLTGDGGFELRAGRQPAEAILDIFYNGSAYAFECATAMMIVLYKALIDTIGNERFNQTFQHLYLWDWQNHPALSLRNVYRVGAGIPGDVRYFKNPDVNPATPQWQGENVVDLSDDHYYGHGIGIMPAHTIIAELNKYRRIGSTTSAFLMTSATRPDFLTLAALAEGRQMDGIRIAAGSSFYAL